MYVTEFNDRIIITEEAPFTKSGKIKKSLVDLFGDEEEVEERLMCISGPTAQLEIDTQRLFIEMDESDKNFKTYTLGSRIVETD